MKFVLFLAALAVLAFASTANASYTRPHIHPPYHIPKGHDSGLVCIGGVTKWVENVNKFIHFNEGATRGGCLVPPILETPPPVVTVQIDRMGTCVDGKFTDLEAGQLAFTDGWYTQATYNGSPVVPANWLEGVGETCDNPLGLGFKPAGYLVSDGGTVDVAAPQFNIYPYYVKA